MPYRRTKRTTRKVAKKKPRYKKKAPQSTMAVAKVGYSSGLRIYPKRFIALMRYKVPYTLAAGTVDTWNNTVFWNATSVFDPDTSGAGSSASLFPQLAAQYNHFTVLKSKFNFKGTLRAGNSMIVAASKCDDTIITHSSIASRLQDTDTKTVVCDNTKPNFSLTSYYDRSKIYQKGNYANLVGSTAANPTENYFWGLATTNLGYGLTPSIVDGVIEITYQVLWSEQREDPNI